MSNPHTLNDERSSRGLPMRPAAAERGEEITINVLKHFTAPQPLYYTGSSCHSVLSCVMGMRDSKVLFNRNLIRFPKIIHCFLS